MSQSICVFFEVVVRARVNDLDAAHRGSRLIAAKVIISVLAFIIPSAAMPDRSGTLT